jgi:hypothetical protein
MCLQAWAGEPSTVTIRTVASTLAPEFCYHRSLSVGEGPPMKALTIASVAVLGLYCLLLTMLALATQTPGVHPLAGLALIKEDIGRHR